MVKSVVVELVKKELLKTLMEASKEDKNWKWNIVKVNNKDCSFEIKWEYLQYIGSKNNFKVEWCKEADNYVMYNEHDDIIEIADDPTEAIRQIVYYGMSRY